MPEIRPIDLSPEGIRESAELLRAVYPQAHHLTPAYLQRLYHGNPLGPTFGFSAFEGDWCVAHFLMIPLKARVHGEEELGIWPFQLATHPEFRSRGIFSEMTERCFVAARERGYGYLSGVGNAMSTPLFVGKWGFQNIGSLEVKVGVGPMPSRSQRSDLEFVRIWEREGIAWRSRLPEEPYRVVHRGERAHLYARAHYGVPVEVGCFDRAQVPDELRPLRTPNPLRMWIGMDSGRDWSRSAYFDLPQRFRPSPLNLLFYDLTDRKRRFDSRRVQYALFDFDAY